MRWSGAHADGESRGLTTTWMTSLSLHLPGHWHAAVMYIQILEAICEELGVPLAPGKKEGPSTRITYLGIVIDTVSGQLSLPADKLQRIRRTVDQWLHRKDCLRRELESLVGTLQHAATVIYPGRSFLRRLLDRTKGCWRPNHIIHLNREFKADLYWWKNFAASWNGVAFFPPTPADLVEFASDASGSWGCGAWHNTQWWQFRWPARVQRDIAYKEMFAVVVSAALWGREWSRKQVRAHCDNEAVTCWLAVLAGMPT